MQGIVEAAGSAARNSRRAFNALLLAGGLAIGATAQAAVTLNVEFSADACWTAPRMAAINAAASNFSSMFASHFGTNGSVVMYATCSDDNTIDTLASAGSDAPYVSGTSFGDTDAIRVKLLTGVDLNGSAADGTIDVNFGYPWQLDPNIPAVDPEFDLFAALNHEFTHALGFYSDVVQPGTDLWGDIVNGQWSKFDSFLVNSLGQPLFTGTTLNQAIWNAASSGADAGIFFNGANAVAAYGGLVPLFTPFDWMDGSSVSHLDTGTFPTEMMKHDRGTGSGEARDYSAVEIGIMADLGYGLAISGVPVFSPLGLLLLTGLVAVLGLRRRT